MTETLYNAKDAEMIRRNQDLGNMVKALLKERQIMIDWIMDTRTPKSAASVVLVIQDQLSFADQTDILKACREFR